jgi:hypothetical protein
MYVCSYVLSITPPRCCLLYSNCGNTHMYGFPGAATCLLVASQAACATWLSEFGIWTLEQHWEEWNSSRKDGIWILAGDAETFRPVIPRSLVHGCHNTTRVWLSLTARLKDSEGFMRHRAKHRAKARFVLKWSVRETYSGQVDTWGLSTVLNKLLLLPFAAIFQRARQMMQEQMGPSKAGARLSCRHFCGACHLVAACELSCKICKTELKSLLKLAVAWVGFHCPKLGSQV